MKILYGGSDTRGQNRSNKHQYKWAFDSLDDEFKDYIQAAAENNIYLTSAIKKLKRSNHYQENVEKGKFYPFSTKEIESCFTDFADNIIEFSYVNSGNRYEDMRILVRDYSKILYDPNFKDSTKIHKNNSEAQEEDNSATPVNLIASFSIVDGSIKTIYENVATDNHSTANDSRKFSTMPTKLRDALMKKCNKILY